MLRTALADLTALSLQVEKALPCVDRPYFQHTCGTKTRTPPRVWKKVKKAPKAHGLREPLSSPASPNHFLNKKRCALLQFGRVHPRTVPSTSMAWKISLIKLVGSVEFDVVRYNSNYLPGKTLIVARTAQLTCSKDMLGKNGDSTSNLVEILLRATAEFSETPFRQSFVSNMLANYCLWF